MVYFWPTLHIILVAHEQQCLQAYRKTKVAVVDDQDEETSQLEWRTD